MPRGVESVKKKKKKKFKTSFSKDGGWKLENQQAWPFWPSRAHPPRATVHIPLQPASPALKT